MGIGPPCHHHCAQEDQAGTWITLGCDLFHAICAFFHNSEGIQQPMDESCIKADLDLTRPEGLDYSGMERFSFFSLISSFFLSLLSFFVYLFLMQYMH